MAIQEVTLFESLAGEPPAPPRSFVSDNTDRKRVEAAMACVEANAAEEWKAAALDVIKAMPAGHFFVSEDVRRRLDEAGYDVHDLRALGPIMVRASKSGLIERSMTLHRDQYGSLKQRWMRSDTQSA